MRADHPAPGLKSAIDRLPRPGASVLDMGPALAANLAFFQPLGVRLRIADFDRTVDEEAVSYTHLTLPTNREV